MLRADGRELKGKTKKDAGQATGDNRLRAKGNLEGLTSSCCFRRGRCLRHDDALSFCIPAGERTDGVLGCGAGDPNRTGDLPFTRRLLCLLSYTGAALGAW